MAYLRALRRVWPHVPCILLIREPVEVLVSLLQKPPEWMPSWYARSGNQRFGDPPRDVRSRGPAECCAWLTGRLCAEGLAMLDESCRIVDYRDLTPEVVLHIGRFFGLQVSSEVESQLGAAFGVHGKRPHQRFTSDSDAKRLEATQAIRDAADEWAKGPYEALRHRAAGDLARLARPSTEPAEGVPS
jgi:hypothetical protein